MEMTTAKTVAVFAIIVGCFIVLYPKIFHPMILHIFGMAPAKRSGDDLATRMPPHLRQAMASGKRGSVREDLPSHMRAGAHPGMRAAAEMKKAAVQQSATGDKGMMGVVLPMYAIGIVLYLLYTLSKVFGRKDKGEGSSTGDYLSSHFADMQSTTDKSGAAMAVERKALQKQKELEKLLMKAESEDINDNEMTELKRRLLETEAQMSRILQAMEAVQQKVGGAVNESTLSSDVAGDDSAGVEDVVNCGPESDHLNINNEQVYADEADDDECSEDDDSDGELDLDLDDLDHGDGYADETRNRQPPNGKLSNSVRLPPPKDQRRNFSSLADELGKPSAEECGDEMVNAGNIGSENEKWRESSVRHRIAASAAGRVD